MTKAKRARATFTSAGALKSVDRRGRKLSPRKSAGTRVNAAGFDELLPGWEWVECKGEAHSNPFIDNCGVCAPYWGRYPRRVAQ